MNRREFLFGSAITVCASAIGAGVMVWEIKDAESKEPERERQRQIYNQQVLAQFQAKITELDLEGEHELVDLNSIFPTGRDTVARGRLRFLNKTGDRFTDHLLQFAWVNKTRKDPILKELPFEHFQISQSDNNLSTINFNLNAEILRKRSQIEDSLSRIRDGNASDVDLSRGVSIAYTSTPKINISLSPLDFQDFKNPSFK